jgi:uncharacterized membrane protein
MRVQYSTVLSVLPLLLAAEAQGQFWSVGVPEGSPSSTLGYALSDDGSVAVGYAAYPGGFNYAYTWNAATGRFDFGRVPGSPPGSRGFGVSGDGRFVVGEMFDVGPDLAFRWSAETGFQSLGPTGNASLRNAAAVDASADGSVVVGYMENDFGSVRRGFIWTQSTGIVAMPQNDPFMDIRDVSADGTKVLGTAGLNGRGFVWTRDGGYQYLRSADPNDPYTEAYGMNSDGSVIVGNTGLARDGALWIGDTVLNLGRLEGSTGFVAADVDETGSVVVGSSEIVGGPGVVATVWTQARGTEFLSDYLVSQGVMIPMNVILRTCEAVSDDGLTFSGSARDTALSKTFGYVIKIPSPTPMAALMAIMVMPQPRRRRSSNTIR